MATSDQHRFSTTTADATLVARDRGSRASLRGRRKMAAWNDAYMLQIIANQAHA
jgi:hypothetical protein